MPNNFCRYLSNQVRSEYGSLQPCCWFTESVDITQPEQVTEFYQSLNKIVDWETSAGRCNYCQEREQRNLFSPRLHSLSRKLFDVDDDSKVSIEIQLDTDCNAACLICGPWNSTTWEKYNNKIKGIPIKVVEDPAIAASSLITRISKAIDFSSAREILFLGGEPLRSNSHLQLLDNIPVPENVTVSYITNGSYKPNKKTLETWKKFKGVRLTFSIDGIGEHFNYLRWPLQWSQVEDNMRFAMSLGPHVTLGLFSYTTTPFSLYYHDVYNKWADNFFEGTGYKNMFSKPWAPRGRGPMDLGAIPPPLQEKIKSKYGTDHEITKLLEPFNPQLYRAFMINAEYHDKHRNLAWREVFPEMQEFYPYRPKKSVDL